jgi:hypothetical protein
VEWHLQSANHHNYTVGAALLYKSSQEEVKPKQIEDDKRRYNVMLKTPGSMPL